MPKRVGLLTDWVTIGTAGKTVDGRTIEDTWLEQMARNYSPAEYTAVINSEHLLSWYGSFGQVRALRTGRDDKGRMVLQARLEPNQRLLDLASFGQHLFLSMEIHTDYCETGEAYLVGLALTDNPASVGTTELRFTKAAENQQFRAEAVELNTDLLRAGEDADEDGRLFALLKRLFSNSHQQKEHDEMNAEQLKALMDGQEKMASGLASLTDAVQALTKPAAAGNETTGTPEAPADDSPTPEFAGKLEALAAGQANLTKGLEGLTETLNKAIETGKGTTFSTGRGAVNTEGDDQPVL